MSVASARGEDSADRLILETARTLLVNGEDTSGVLTAARRMADSSGLPVAVEPGWDEIRLTDDGRVLLGRPAVPWAVNMRRVVATMDLVARWVREGGPSGAFRADLHRAATLPAYDAWLFAFACAFGAFGLTILNGAEHPLVPTVVAASAAAGAFLRRGLAAIGGNALLQLFAATLLAGAVGGIAARAGVPATTGLVALGPLFVLVPGPALLGGVFDLAGLRLPLGIARTTFGLLSIAMLCAGVLIGSGVTGGAAPTPQMPQVPLPIWADMLCAAAASAAYAIFFAMPVRMLPLPVVVGALAHGLRWIALNQWHWGNAAAAGIACLLAGAIVEPVARRWGLPFAAVGFASVVSQVPGVYLFRMSSGLLELQALAERAPEPLIARIIADGGTALLTLVAMGLGLTIAKVIAMRLVRSR